MTTASDNFNRANETPLASPWTTTTGFSQMNLVSNAAEGSSSADSIAVYNSLTWGPNQTVSVVVGNLSTNNNYSGAGARWDTSGNGFFVWTDGTGGAGHCGISSSAGGSETVLANSSTTFANGDTIGIDISGTSPNITINLQKNGTTVTTVSSVSGNNNGQPAMYAYNNIGPNNDNFNATDNSGASATYPVPQMIFAC